MKNAAPKIATVSIVHEDARAAAREAAIELKDLLGCEPDIVLVFFSAALPAEQVRDGLYEVLPESTVLVACSSYAELGPDGPLTGSVTALGLKSPSHRAVVLSAEGGPDAFEEGRKLGEAVKNPRPSLLLLFPDVLTLNATRFLRGVQSVLGKDVPVLGGAPADMGEFKKTSMIHGGEIQHQGAVALALFGPIEVSASANSGYTPVSLPLVATRVENGNVLLELDGKPALQVYVDCLGPRRAEMPAVTIEYPLGVLAPGHSAAQVESDIVRAVFRVDEQRNALILGGDIPEQATLRILSAGRGDVLSGARAAIESALARSGGPDLVLLFNCMSRKVILGPRYKEEGGVVESILKGTIPSIGFYTFGEMSPVGAVAEHHESTFTVGMLRFG